jgi:hypothetical protein
MADDDKNENVEKKLTTTCQNEAIKDVVAGTGESEDSQYHPAFDEHGNSLESFIVGHYQRQKVRQKRN